MGKIEKTIGNILNIYYYYFIVLSVLNLLFLYFKIESLSNIMTILMIASIVIHLILGYTKGILGFGGMLIIIGITYLKVKDIWLCISIGLSITGIINFIFNEIINKIFHLIVKMSK